MMSLKVAIVHKDIGPEDRGGISVLYKHLAKGLAARGTKIFIVSQHESASETGIEYITLPQEADPIRYSRLVRSAIQQLPIDVAECSTWRFELADFIKAPARSAKVIVRCDPSVETLFGDGHAYALHEKDIVQNADLRIAVSRFAANDILHRYRAQSELTIYNGVDTASHSDRNIYLTSQTLTEQNGYLDLFDDGSTAKIIWIGKRTYMKGFDLFQKMVIEMPDRFQFIVNESPVPQPIPWDSQALNRVDRISNVPRLQHYEIIKMCDCCLISSRVEGFSYVCAEALSLGVPVIANQDCNVLREFDAGPFIQFVDLSNTPEIEDAILRAQSIQNKLAVLPLHYSVSSMVEETSKAYLSIL